jgi:hypothetical protein
MNLSFTISFKRIFALGTVLAALATPLAATAQQAWKIYTYSNAGFSIASPVAPKADIDTVDTDSGPMQMSTYEGDDADTVLVVSICDFSKAKGNLGQDMLKAQEAALEATHGHIIRKRTVSLGAYQGTEYESENDKMHIFARAYMVKQVLYQEIVAFPIASEYPDAQRFLDSFRLTPHARG